MQDDAETLALLRRRDPRGFERAYAAYAAPLLGFLTRLTREPALAEDLLQQVFMRLAERGAELRRDSNLRAWLYAVARNASVSERRRAPPEREPGELELLPCPPPDVEARLLLGDVERALARLRVEDREVLLLAAVGGFEGDELSELLALEPAAFRQRLSRARARLLAELARATDAVTRKASP